MLINEKFVTPVRSDDVIYVTPVGLRVTSMVTFQHPAVADPKSADVLEQPASFEIKGTGGATAVGGAGADYFELRPGSSGHSVYLIYGMAGEDRAVIYFDRAEVSLEEAPGNYSFIKSLDGRDHNIHIELENIEHVEFVMPPSVEIA